MLVLVLTAINGVLLIGVAPYLQALYQEGLRGELPGLTAFVLATSQVMGQPISLVLVGSLLGVGSVAYWRLPATVEVERLTHLLLGVLPLLALLIVVALGYPALFQTYGLVR
ncbi:MAG: hypothetical protein NW237_10070 [Cyanobacteriota bacterium]|nr:hypothetical protein [Cyanobacteriota bacterium]